MDSWAFLMERWAFFFSCSSEIIVNCAQASDMLLESWCLPLMDSFTSCSSDDTGDSAYGPRRLAGAYPEVSAALLAGIVVEARGRK